MSLKIITDSASDILQSQYPDVTVIPLTITFGDVEYLDGINLTQSQFFEKLVESDTLPTTSQINPATFEKYFSEVKSAGDEAIVITISSDLSGTYQSACIAAEDYADCISVIDSRQVCIGQHILVKEALSLMKKPEKLNAIIPGLGTTREKLTSYLNSMTNKIHLIALLDTLEYLRKGGRIGNTVGAIGEALSIKPVIAISEGKVKILGKARGSKNGNNLLNSQISQCSGIDYTKPIAVAYSGLTDIVLNKYLADNTDLWSDYKDPLIKSQIGGTIGTHIGPGAIAVAFFENQK